MDEEEDDVPTCPLCLEELDATDRAVKACQCGYQVCLLCLHTIREQLNQRCPACRTPYEEQNFKIGDVDPEEAAKEVKERRTAKKERERREKLKEIERERERALLLSQQKAKSNLQHVRILQRNLVYIIGLSLSLAREEVIRRNDMFGKFGRMLRVLVNRSHPFHADAPGGPSISAYVQYHRDIDAGSAVRAMNNAVLDGREIRCAIATSKYCEAFVAGAQNSDITTTAFYHCGNTNCLYYHTTAQSDNILTREEVLARQLGPPPPSHLFLPVIPRRSGPPSASRGTNSHPTTPQPSSASAATTVPGRSSNISVPTSQPHTLMSTFNSTSSLSQPPMTAALLEHTQASSSRKMPVAMSAGKSPSMSASSPRVAEGPLSLSRSSPEPQSDRKQANASTRNPLTANPHASHLSSVPLPFSGTSDPLPGTSTWASTQSGHPVPQGRKKPASSTIHDAALSEGSGRLPTQFSQHVGDVPPGFENNGLVPSLASFPSKPPGFDVPLKSLTRSEDSLGVSSRGGNSVNDHEKEVAFEANSPSLRSGLTPPPGFGSYPVLHVDSHNSDQTHANEWLRKAHSDEVFSRRERTLPFVGEIGSRAPVMRSSTSVDGAINPDEQSSSSLRQVMASIGGSLGIRSEFRDITGSTSKITRAEPRLQAGPSNVPDDREKDYMQVVESDRTCNSAEQFSRPVDHSSSESMAALNGKRLLALGSSETIRSAVPVPARRKHSRFVFARQGRIESIGDSGGADCIVWDRSVSRDGGHIGLPHFGLGKSEPTDVRNVSKFSELLSSKKGTSGRHARSRFDFADQNCFSLQGTAMHGFPGAQVEPNSIAVRSSEAKSASMTDDMNVNGLSGSEPRDEFQVFGGLGSQVRDEHACQSVRWVFKSSKSAPPFNHTNDTLAPFFDLNALQDASTQGDTVSAKDNADNSGLSDSVACSNTAQAETSNSKHMLSLDGNRGSKVKNFYPPGFREATSGILPDITAGEKSSATGVASQVSSGEDKPVIVFGQSGSTRSDAPSTVHSIEEQTSSGTEAVEEDRKKIRTQKKRDRKRVGRDLTERKMVKKDNLPPGSSQFGIRSIKDKTFNRGKALGVIARSPEETESEDYEVSDNDFWQGQRTGPGSGAGITEKGEAKNESGRNFYNNDGNFMATDEKNVVRREGSVGISNSAASRHGHRAGDESGRYLSVSELEREVEAARVREAQLQDKLMEITRRLRSYDNVRS